MKSHRLFSVNEQRTGISNILKRNIVEESLVLGGKFRHLAPTRLVLVYPWRKYEKKSEAKCRR